MRIKFRFRTVPLLATVILVALGVALGQWQDRRALEKETIEAKLVSREAAPSIRLGSSLQHVDDIEYRRVSVTGEFRADWPLYLDNRPSHGTAGFYLLMPFHIAGSERYVMVARGWIPRNAAERMRVPPVVTPSGTIEIAGIARRNAARSLSLGQDPLRPGSFVQNFDLAEFGRASTLPLQPFLLEQLTDTHDGLVRDWPRPSSGAEMHRGYAFQWYALALMALLFFIVTGFRNGTR
jgi:cytochrome oxidase assembly protein ShyY1